MSIGPKHLNSPQHLNSPKHLRGRSKHFLVIGASGTVGQTLSQTLARHGRVTGTAWTRTTSTSQALDIREEDQVAKCLEINDPDVVILCSALSNVAACEADPDSSQAINTRGPQHVAKHCGHRKLVFFSSDAVFSDRKELWLEHDTPDPSSTYGRQKAEAEEIVASCPNHLILRTARLYSARGGDGKFIDFVLRTLKEGGTVQAPRETPGNPTLLDDLCSATEQLIEAGERGIWHLAGPPIDSLYETARQIATTFNIDVTRVHGVARDHGSNHPRISARLDTGKAEQAGLRFRDLAAGLELRRSAESDEDRR